jgi:hypothetical protein
MLLCRLISSQVDFHPHIEIWNMLECLYAGFGSEYETTTADKVWSVLQAKARQEFH